MLLVRSLEFQTMRMKGFDKLCSYNNRNNNSNSINEDNNSSSSNRSNKLYYLRNRYQQCSIKNGKRRRLICYNSNRFRSSSFSMLMYCCWLLLFCSSNSNNNNFFVSANEVVDDNLGTDDVQKKMNERKLLLLSKENGWREENFPNPSTHPELCRSLRPTSTTTKLSSSGSVSSDINDKHDKENEHHNVENIQKDHSIIYYHRLCDPDSILSADEIISLQTKLSEDRTFVIQPQKEQQKHCQKKIDNGERTTESSIDADVQIGIAIVNKMDLRPFDSRQSNLEEKISKNFARYVHDSWGVGIELPCGYGDGGSTGILIFLSIADKAIYISRGDAVSEYVSDTRIGSTIEAITPYLRQNKYHEALEICIDEISDYVTLKGKPSFWESHKGDIIIISILMFVLLYILYDKYVVEAQARLYVKVNTHLNEIDKARAEALQGKYRTTSCPICFETFVMGSNDSNNSSCSDSDNENDNYENDDSSNHDTKEEEESKLVPVTGPDNLPVKLLRCGHIFCETCWSEWIDSGSGDVRKCPICREDVTTNNDNKVTASTTSIEEADNNDNDNHGNDHVDDGRIIFEQQQNELRQRRGGRQGQMVNNIINNVLQERRQQQQQHQHHRQRQLNVLRLVNQERNFRLNILRNRYPQFIRPQQIQQWTQSTYDGTLTRDPNFVDRNPRLIETSPSSSSSSNSGFGSNYGSSSTSSSFGGGSSGGGRGGRW